MDKYQYNKKTPEICVNLLSKYSFDTITFSEELIEKRSPTDCKKLRTFVFQFQINQILTSLSTKIYPGIQTYISFNSEFYFV